jgi:hypothetical protein
VWVSRCRSPNNAKVRFYLPTHSAILMRVVNQWFASCAIFCTIILRAVLPSPSSPLSTAYLISRGRLNRLSRASRSGMEHRTWNMGHGESMGYHLSHASMQACKFVFIILRSTIYTLHAPPTSHVCPSTCLPACITVRVACLHEASASLHPCLPAHGHGEWGCHNKRIETRIWRLQISFSQKNSSNLVRM